MKLDDTASPYWKADATSAKLRSGYTKYGSLSWTGMTDAAGSPVGRILRGCEDQYGSDLQKGLFLYGGSWGHCPRRSSEVAEAKGQFSIRNGTAKCCVRKLSVCCLLMIRREFIRSILKFLGCDTDPAGLAAQAEIPWEAWFPVNTT